MSDTTARIAALLRDIPRVGVEDETRADWFDRKASLFAEIADQGGPTAEDAAEAAATARMEARRLRRGGGAP
jgi:hypothetical protein